MKIIITESQYKKILLEQSNVYTDETKYDYALKTYNALWYLYNIMASQFEKINSFNYKDNYRFLNSEKFEKIFEIKELNPQMENFLLGLSDEVLNSVFKDGYYITFWCKGTNGMWETKTELEKSNMTRQQQVKKVCPNAVDFDSIGHVVFSKPNILKPIIQLTYTKPIIQQFNYMSIENKTKALKKYGSVSDIPYQGVDINKL